MEIQNAAEEPDPDVWGMPVGIAPLLVPEIEESPAQGASRLSHRHSPHSAAPCTTRFLPEAGKGHSDVYKLAWNRIIVPPNENARISP